ncbi:flavin-containing monooxygenase 1-like isoform X2 [Lissotriton helveticus]
MVKKVAVIGAGCSGLGAVKCCLEEGLEPTCFEKSDDIGGLWNFKEEVEEGRGSIYKSLVTNGSKEMMCYSDFLIPDDFPNYLHNSKVLEYLKLYAKHFGLMEHIKLKTKVCMVKKRIDYSITGQWEVVTETDGIERFKGKCFHSQEYKYPDGFKGKRVLVVGIGNSGADIATELSHVSAKVLLSSRRGAWIMSRTGEGGYPYGLLFLTRFKTWLRLSLPNPVVFWLVERHLNHRFDQSNYGLQRDSNSWKEILVSDDLPYCIIRGSVVVKPSVAEFSESSVTFDDGTSEDIDIIIFATGFHPAFPFLEESVIKPSINKCSLYKYVFPPDLEKPTLSFIGMIKPIGSILNTAEIQARWATRVVRGLNKLPSLEKRLEEIAERSKMVTKRYGTPQGNALQIELIEYRDEIASEIGVKPNIFQLLLTDPVLALQVFFGACTSPQYRLTGPGKWDGARNAILTTWDRVVKPTKTRVTKNKYRSFPLSTQLGLLCLFTLFAFVFLSD